MAKVQISVHSDLREDAQPLVDALQHIADSIEGFYGYKLVLACQALDTAMNASTSFIRGIGATAPYPCVDKAAAALA